MLLELSHEQVIVTYAYHLSLTKEHTPFLFGGSDYLYYDHFEEALIKQHIPRREPAQAYHERLYNIGAFDPNTEAAMSSHLDRNDTSKRQMLETDQEAKDEQRGETQNKRARLHQNSGEEGD